MRVIAPSLASFLLASNAFAAEPVVNPQAIMKVVGGVPVDDTVSIGMFASAFITPGNDPLYFAYVGPGFTPTGWWWTSPRIGMEMNLPVSGETRPIVSWWNVVTLSKRYSIFLESDVYPDLLSGEMIYYGYYSVERDSTLLNLGIHAEQVNLGVTVGPHVAVNFGGHLTAGVEYHWGLAESHAIRVIVKLKP